MITIKKEKLAMFQERAHTSIIRKEKQAGRTRGNLLLENRIFAILAEKSNIEPSKCAIRLEKEYDYDITGDDIIRIFRGMKLGNPQERQSLFRWAYQVAELFGKSMEGDKKAFEEFEKLRKEPYFGSAKRHRSQERICAIVIYQKFPEIAAPGDEETLYKLGDVYARYFFYEMCDALCDLYGFPGYKASKKAKVDAMPIEQAMKEIEMLRNELERTNGMLSDLQNEFEEQLNESKIKETTDFFAKLNSEKYGCILDQLLALRKGVDTLRKSGFEVPVEISGILIVIRKMWQFVTDSHIHPMLKPDSELIVTASKVESADYIGTPFASEDEEKIVKVLSPGWIFKDKEIQISRPRLQELKDD